MSQLTLQRQWRLIEALHGKRRGLSIRGLMEAVETSRATLYRDLQILQESGFPIETRSQNGEVRYRLLGEALPPVMPTLRQIFALRLARRLLTPLEGTQILRELDALLPRMKAPGDREPAVRVQQAPTSGAPSIVRAIESALNDRRRLRFTYAATRGAPAQRTVDPIGLYVVDGQLYFNAVDVDKSALRTFKVARISEATVLEDRAQSHPEHDEARIFEHAAKVWDGELADVVVRLSPRAARFVSEWPLIASQQVEPQPDGSALVRARVSGTVEAMRWVLRWGKDAQVISPPELRAQVLHELMRAIGAYAGEVPPDR